jgi:hypothetical protein
MVYGTIANVIIAIFWWSQYNWKNNSEMDADIYHLKAYKKSQPNFLRGSINNWRALKHVDHASIEQLIAYGSCENGDSHFQHNLESWTTCENVARKLILRSAGYSVLLKKKQDNNLSAILYADDIVKLVPNYIKERLADLQDLESEVIFERKNSGIKLDDVDTIYLDGKVMWKPEHIKM